MSEPKDTPPEITYTHFNDESELGAIQQLVDKELSEPYSIYTYRYFVYNWPRLCIFARHGERYVGVIVCKLETEPRQGYIAMLVVEPGYRLLKIGTTLVERAIETMLRENADEIVLETELTNKAALRLYGSLGFIREQRLLRYYLNGVDALRLKLILPWRDSGADQNFSGIWQSGSWAYWLIKLVQGLKKIYNWGRFATIEDFKLGI